MTRSGEWRLERFRWWHIEPVMPWERELFGPWSWSTETYWSELAAPGRAYTVALDPRDDVLGWVGLAWAGDQGDIQTIATTPPARGTGLGRALLERALADAAQHGVGQVLLEVRADNAPAIALYERCGFAQYGVRPRYYQPGDVDAWLMRRSVTPVATEGMTT